YQAARFGAALPRPERVELELVTPQDRRKPSFPANEVQRTRAVSVILATAQAPLSAADIAARFRQGRKVEREIALTLRAFARYGELGSADGGQTYSLRRAA